MIVLRKFKSSDLENIKELFRDEHNEIFKLNLNGIIYLALVEEKIVGAIQVEQIQNTCTLNYIYIDKKWRNQKIGDGLLKVLVDKLDKSNVKKLIFNSIDPYLMKKGFEEKEDNILELDIENFFNKQCSCCGNADEI